jgi:hypothetical protein
MRPHEEDLMGRRLAAVLLGLIVVAGCNRDNGTPNGRDRRDNDKADIKIRAPGVKVDVESK